MYKVIERVGRGSYSIVYKANFFLKKQKTLTAVKKFTQHESNQGIDATTLREISLLTGMNHSNLIKLIFIEPNYRYVVMDYYQYDLKKLIETLPNTVDENLSFITFEIIKGINYFHSKQVIHRDIKPANILISLTDKINVVITDLGISRKHTTGDKTPEICTIWYRPPEILLGQRDYDYSVDMWSLGCVIGEMITKEPLFDGENELDQLNKIFKLLGTPANYPLLNGFNFINHPNSVDDKFSTIDPDLKILLKQLLTVDPLYRITSLDSVKSACFSFYSTVIETQTNELPLDLSKSLDNHSEITLSNRETLLEWLIEVKTEYNLSTVSYLRAQHILDRFCYKTQNIKRNNYQLIGITCLWIASKIEEVSSIDSKEIVYVTDYTYTMKELLKMEKTILNTLGYDVYFKIPSDYIMYPTKEDYSMMTKVGFNLEFMKYNVNQLCPNNFPKEVKSWLD